MKSANDLCREIEAGLDTWQTEESLSETPHPDEEDYSPMSKGTIEL